MMELVRREEDLRGESLHRAERALESDLPDQQRMDGDPDPSD